MSDSLEDLLTSPTRMDFTRNDIIRIEAIQKQEAGCASVRKSSNSPFDDQILQQKQLLRTPSKEDYLLSSSPKRIDNCKEVGSSGNGTAMWLATTSAEQTKTRFGESEMPDPPLEYCELPRKGMSESNGDLKRGILSSIFDKVRSKDENGKKTVDCLPFGKDDHRRSQPLLDNLLMDCAGGGRSRDDSDSIVQKPYEPPALGKSSRITPVGSLGAGEEQTSALQSQVTAGPETDAVEVLSVIRYNKSKVSSSLTPSTMRSHSGSDTASVMSQQCLTCSDNRLTKSERSLDSQEGERQEERQEGDCEALSYHRRSSAPEIDHESPSEEESRARREIFTRSLGRTRRPGGEAGRSSDGECPADHHQLQRARAHLKETLEGKMEKMKKIEAEKYQTQSETKAVVHRSEAQHSKTLDSEAIKQYQNIKQNTTLPTIKQQRYSGVFDKSGKAERQREQHHQPLYKQSSFDNLNLNRNTEPVNLARDRNEGEVLFRNISFSTVLM